VILYQLPCIGEIPCECKCVLADGWIPIHKHILITKINNCLKIDFTIKKVYKETLIIWSLLSNWLSNQVICGQHKSYYWQVTCSCLYHYQNNLHHKLTISQNFNRIRAKIVKQYVHTKFVDFKM
jgi:hypothetical protein